MLIGNYIMNLNSFVIASLLTLSAVLPAYCSDAPEKNAEGKRDDYGDDDSSGRKKFKAASNEVVNISEIDLLYQGAIFGQQLAINELINRASNEKGNGEALTAIFKLIEQQSYAGAVQPLSTLEQLFEKLSVRGNPAIKVRLARLYRFGKGVARDLDKACSLFRQAVELGDERCISELKEMMDVDGHAGAAYFLAKRELVWPNQNISDALRLYLKATFLGSLEAENHIKDISKIVDKSNAEKKTLKGLFLEIKRKAKENDVNALFELALIYEKGLEFKPNANNAIDNYCKAAVLGHEKALIMLEAIVEQGSRTLIESIAEGLKPYHLHEDLAERMLLGASAEKIYRIGKIHEKNNDTDRCAQFFGAAAELGHADALARLKALSDRKVVTAQYILGSMYENGVSVEKDTAKAVVLYEKAARKNHLKALYRLGLIYRDGAEVAQDLNKAVSRFISAVELGSVDAQYHLGMMYLNGMGVEPDIEKSFSYIKNAADLGHKEALFSLVNFYTQGLITNFNESEIVELLNQAAQQGHIGAVAPLTGLAEKGNTEAQYVLGNLYANGKAVAVNAPEAVKWYGLAANSGHLDALCAYGLALATGWGGIVKNAEEACKYYRIAAEKGHANARISLAKLIISDWRLSCNDEAAYCFMMSNSGTKELADLIRFDKKEPRRINAPKVDSENASSQVAQKPMSALAQVAYEVDKFGLLEEQSILENPAMAQLSVTPMLHPLMTRLMSYVHKLTELSSHLNNSPVLCTSFYCTFAIKIYANYFHDFRYDNKSYYTIGDIHVKKIRDIEKIIDPMESTYDEYDFSFLPSCLAAEAEINAAKQLNCLLYASQMQLEQAQHDFRAPFEIETIGQAISCSKLLVSMYTQTLELLKGTLRGLDFACQGANFEDPLQTQMKMKKLMVANAIDEIGKIIPWNKKLHTLLVDTKKEIGEQINNVAGRNILCIKDPVYEPLVIAHKLSRFKDKLMDE